MTTRLIDLEERVGNWHAAYSAVRAEITPQGMRDVLAGMEEVDGIAQLSSYMSLARGVMSNDRTAALVAAMLVTNGIRPILVEEERDE